MPNRSFPIFDFLCPMFRLLLVVDLFRKPDKIKYRHNPYQSHQHHARRSCLSDIKFLKDLRINIKYERRRGIIRTPPVIIKIMSKILKLPMVSTISVKKICGEIIGSVILKKVQSFPALSRLAAS